MAIRRVSDLPELTSIYQDADLDKCLFEVSYKNDNIYQSFYAKGKTVTDKVVEKIGGSIDLTKYVTKDTEQLITGFKSFRSDNGIMVNGTYLSSVNDSGNAIENSSREGAIKQVPSLKAVKDFVESKGYISDHDTSWVEPLAMLSSMLNEDNLILYVDQTNGDDTKDGKSVSTAVKTLEKAIQIANKRKYIGSACFIIYVIGKYIVTAENGKFKWLNVYHPDMTGTKYGQIRGYPSSGSIPEAEIQINYDGITSYYATWLYIYSNTRIYDLKITAIWDPNRGPFPTAGTYKNKLDYIYNASWAGTGITTRNFSIVETYNVRIKGFRWGIVGSCTLGDNTIFEDCTVGVTPNTGDSVQCGRAATVYIKGICDNPVRLINPNGSFSLNYYTHFDVEQCCSFVTNNSNSTCYLRCYDTNTPAYIDANNPYGLQIHRIIKTVDDEDKIFNLSSDDGYFLVKSTDSLETKKQKINNYLFSIIGSSSNKTFTESSEITPNFTNRSAMNNNFKFVVGPALIMNDKNFNDNNKVNYISKIFYLLKSQW